MKSTMKSFTALVLLASMLSFSQAHATEDNFDLKIDNEQAIADSDAEVEEALHTREYLEQERIRQSEEAVRLKEETRMARNAEAMAHKDRLQNEREIARLQKAGARANAELRDAKKVEAKAQQKLKVAEAYASKTKRSYDAIMKKKEAAVARMNERQEQSKQMIAKAKQAWADYKTADAQYKQALQREKAQKLALEKKKALLKKKMSEMKLKTDRLKAMTKKIAQGRAG
jgi:hypothetical protein